MRFACWITKATDTHSEFVMLSAFYGHNGYANAPEYYVYTYEYISPLVNYLGELQQMTRAVCLQTPAISELLIAAQINTKQIFDLFCCRTSHGDLSSSMRLQSGMLLNCTTTRRLSCLSVSS